MRAFVQNSAIIDGQSPLDRCRRAGIASTPFALCMCRLRLLLQQLLGFPFIYFAYCSCNCCASSSYSSYFSSSDWGSFYTSCSSSFSFFSFINYSTFFTSYTTISSNSFSCSSSSSFYFYSSFLASFSPCSSSALRHSCFNASSAAKQGSVAATLAGRIWCPNLLHPQQHPLTSLTCAH